MATNVRRLSASRVVAGLLLAASIGACGASPGLGASPSRPNTSPVASPSPSPTRVAPDPSNTPAPSPTSPAAASPAPSADSPSPFSWLAPIDTSVDATFRADEFVTAEIELVPVSEKPGGAPFRMDTGDPDPATHPLIGYGKDMLLVVLHGPVVVDDVQWYFLTPAQLLIDVPTGWAPAVTPDGAATLAPAAYSCPPSPMTVDQLEPTQLVDGLAACYGSAEITIAGDLACTAEPVSWVTGAPWLAGGSCSFDSGAHFRVFGLDPNLAPGRYAVTGHFDDPAARECRSPEDPDAFIASAILSCRNAFVASSTVRIDSP